MRPWMNAGSWCQRYKAVHPSQHTSHASRSKHVAYSTSCSRRLLQQKICTCGTFLSSPPETRINTCAYLFVFHNSNKWFALCGKFATLLWNQMSNLRLRAYVVVSHISNLTEGTNGELLWLLRNQMSHSNGQDVSSWQPHSIWGPAALVIWTLKDNLQKFINQTSILHHAGMDQYMRRAVQHVGKYNAKMVESQVIDYNVLQFLLVAHSQRSSLTQCVVVKPYLESPVKCIYTLKCTWHMASSNHIPCNVYIHFLKQWSYKT